MLYKGLCEKVGIATRRANRKELDCSAVQACLDGAAYYAVFAMRHQRHLDYSTMHNTAKIHRKFDIYFKASAEPDLKWSFFPLQECITVNERETKLAFYRALNANRKSTIGISAYLVHTSTRSSTSRNFILASRRYPRLCGSFMVWSRLTYL
jgi:hypothetical protein